MNEFYLWCVTGATLLVMLNTGWRLLTQHNILVNESLTDEDRAFVWRIVVFLVFPLLNYIDLRATIVAAEFAGGYVKDFVYGLLWYQATPQGLSSHMVLPVEFAGWAVQLVLGLCILPALLFRPHPFVATLIGYTVSFIFALNLIIDPVASTLGMGSDRWQLIYWHQPMPERMAFLGFHLLVGGAYVALMRAKPLRIWFCSLSRPAATDELKEALMRWQSQPANEKLQCKVGILYDKAGLRRQANSHLCVCKSKNPHSLYTCLLEGILLYRKRQYAKAQKIFLSGAQAGNVEGWLKSSLLAAAGCCAFAAGKSAEAMSLCDQSLAIDEFNMVARMVRIDIFLSQGKKEEAGAEILATMRNGLSQDVSEKIPIDYEKALDYISHVESSQSPVMADSAS